MNSKHLHAYDAYKEYASICTMHLHVFPELWQIENIKYLEQKLMKIVWHNMGSSLILMNYEIFYKMKIQPFLFHITYNTFEFEKSEEYIYFIFVSVLL